MYINIINTSNVNVKYCFFFLLQNFTGSSLRFKREVEEVHSIDVRRVKEKLTEAYHEIKPMIENLVAEVAPSIHENIQLKYLPAIRSMKALPFSISHIYPQIQESFKFSLKIADKLIERTYRAYKFSNSTHLAIITVSDLIDEVYEEIEPLIEMGRLMSAQIMNNGQNRVKREVSENNLEEVHLIDIHLLRNKLTETYHSLKPLLKDIAADIAPSMYEKFAHTYLPKFWEIENDVLPFFEAKVYPQIKKYTTFGRKVAEKLVDKAYRSYQLSNSTHINIVSISDVIDEVYIEMKPILDLVKYLSTRMTMGNRHYRG